MDGAMDGVLWIVGTPIGNLGDLAPRARETLEAVDLVVCEDTRRTGKLLAGLGLSKPMRSFFEGNERERVAGLIQRLQAGRAIALVTDGGMPSVSDPGYRLVAACADAGIEVRVVPGPSAALAALVVSGLPTDRFAFEGFLPRKEGERRRRLESLRDDPRTSVLFESPRRVQGLLRDVRAVMGDRRIAVARELTKMHEQVLRGSVSEVLDRLGADSVRGEVAIVIAAERDPSTTPMATCVAEAADLVSGGMRKREAARVVADRHGVSANDVYAGLLGS
jgi:16S rRNA (cytidine1402-2'-O)-methyltransferase